MMFEPKRSTSPDELQQRVDRFYELVKDDEKIAKLSENNVWIDANQDTKRIKIYMQRRERALRSKPDVARFYLERINIILGSYLV